MNDTKYQITTPICKRCGDRRLNGSKWAGQHDVMPGSDAPHPGGLGVCGDLHVWGYEHDPIIVTRHTGLVSYLILEYDLVDVPVVAHATADDIRGRHVIGVVPLHLAAVAERVTVVPLDLPAEMRGVELSAADVAQYAGTPKTYRVDRVSVA